MNHILRRLFRGCINNKNNITPVTTNENRPQVIPFETPLVVSPPAFFNLDEIRRRNQEQLAKANQEKAQQEEKARQAKLEEEKKKKMGEIARLHVEITKTISESPDLACSEVNEEWKRLSRKDDLDGYSLQVTNSRLNREKGSLANELKLESESPEIFKEREGVRRDLNRMIDTLNKILADFAALKTMQNDSMLRRLRIEEEIKQDSDLIQRMQQEREQAEEREAKGGVAFTIYKSLHS